jgi:hypothetical protein
MYSTPFGALTPFGVAAQLYVQETPESDSAPVMPSGVPKMLAPFLTDDVGAAGMVPAGFGVVRVEPPVFFALALAAALAARAFTACAKAAVRAAARAVGVEAAVVDGVVLAEPVDPVDPAGSPALC